MLLAYFHVDDMSTDALARRPSRGGRSSAHRRHSPGGLPRATTAQREEGPKPSSANFLGFCGQQQRIATPCTSDVLDRGVARLDCSFPFQGLGLRPIGEHQFL